MKKQSPPRVVTKRKSVDELLNAVLEKSDMKLVLSNKLNRRYSLPMEKQSNKLTIKDESEHKR